VLAQSERDALRLLRSAAFGFFFLVWAALIAGCGQPPPEGSEQQQGGNTEETTGGTTTASGSEFQGVVDSYAEFYHYANSFSIPESGTYTLRAELEPPDFNRHGDKDGEGRVFTEPVTVEFENVEISPEEG
jgi:Fe2+ transport protein